jgi:ribosomal protein S27AE
VPVGMKASICPNCGHSRVIPRTEPHKSCGICGDRIPPEGQ